MSGRARKAAGVLPLQAGAVLIELRRALAAMWSVALVTPIRDETASAAGVLGKLLRVGLRARQAG